MRRAAAALLFAGSAACAGAQPVVQSARARPGVHTLALGIANVHVLVGERGAVLVDAGGPDDAEAIVEGLAELGLRPEQVGLIVLSHGHGDHAGAAAELRRRTGARVVSHAGDAEMLEAGRNRPLRPMSLTARLIRPFVDLDYPPLEADLLIAAPLALEPYGVAGRVLPLPGHTPGSLWVQLEGGEAVVGDLLAGGYLGGALAPTSPGGHYYHDAPCTIRGNIEQVLAQGTERLHLGHGGPVSAADLRAALADGTFDCDEDEDGR